MGQIAPALIQGPQEMIRRTMLSYIRAQEEAADRAGVKFLNATQQSAKGMYLTFKRFADDQLVVASRIDPYQQTHPMPRERMAHLEDLIKTSGYWEKADPPELQLRHDMMRAKLAGFLDRPDIDRAALSLDRHQPAGALCARDFGVPHQQPVGRADADRRADPGAAEQSLLP